MNCPVCDRTLAPTLSICTSCGAMMYDSVREELESKLISGRLTPQTTLTASPIREPGAVPEPLTPRPVIKAPLPIRRQETAGLAAPKTSPTLVGFQSKNPALPDWRVELQNAVQQRRGVQNEANATAGVETGTHFPVDGSAALKVEIVPQREPILAEEISDPRVTNALRRIEESRKAFLEVEVPKSKPANVRPFGVVSPNTNTSRAAAPAKINFPVRPTLVGSTPVELKRDTNKLPLLIKLPGSEATAAETVIERVEKIGTGPLPTEFAEVKRIRIKADHDRNDVEPSDHETDEIEDLAPFSMRFGAGLFDIIIGTFASMLILSPIAFTSGSWFSGTGFLTVLATCAVVTFAYMTICLGFFGKTLGMRLFSLELVDAVENEYPTLRQAAVNSSVFIFSLLFGGAGFLTVLFNEEKRAAHDLLSGTILVREF